MALVFGAFDDSCSSTRTQSAAWPVQSEGAIVLPIQRGARGHWPAPWPADPFAVLSQPEPIVLRGYEITATLGQSHTGGTYRAVELATFRTVVVQELRLPAEHQQTTELTRHHEVLRRLHAVAPGVAPEPLAHFSEADTSYLVTELVGGRALRPWAARANPSTNGDRGAGAQGAYYTLVLDILRQLGVALAKISACGWEFGTVRPSGVLVTKAGVARLTGFGRVTPADGSPPAEHPLAEVAACLLWPGHDPVERDASALPRLWAELDRVAPVPVELWRVLAGSAPLALVPGCGAADTSAARTWAG